MDWYWKVLRQYADFSGRARRMEYWMFALVNLVIGVAIMGVGFGLMAALGSTEHAAFGGLMVIPFFLYWLAILIPSLAVTVRRLHDTGRSGWWYLIAFVPFFGGLILLVFMLLGSEAGPNAWGQNPKDPYALAPAYYPPQM